MRSYWALMYSTVFSSPAEPGARPSNSSEARVVIRVRRSSASIPGLKTWSAAGAASGAAASTAGAAGSRLHAASSRLAAQARVRVERILWTPGKAVRPILRGCGNRGLETGVRVDFPLDGSAGKDLSGKSTLTPAAPSVRRRSGRAVGHGRGAGHPADARGVVHVEGDLALELQLALDHGAGADDDLRPALADLHRQPVRRGLVDPDPAGHVRTDPDGDIAAHRLDAAGQVDIDQPDRPVHGLDVAADAPARTDEDAAVHRFHAVAHGRALADADAAVDGGQAVGMDVGGGADAAVHGLGSLHDGAAVGG